MANFLLANWPAIIAVVVMLVMHRAMGCGKHSHHRTQEPLQAEPVPVADPSDARGAR